MRRVRKRPILWILRLIAVGLVSFLGWIGWNQATYNFEVTQPGRLYRSGQMPGWALRRAIRDHHIRTVLNLRGPNPSESWYRQEVTATLEGGATHVDIPLSSCVWMSRVQLRTVIDVLDRAEYPLLVHCAWGSERTGLTSAIAELLKPGGSLEKARDQLALRFLYVRLGDGRIMAEFLDQYEAWLVDRGQAHRPETFRKWAVEGYRPGTPNREGWPYDPSPLRTVTRPAPEERDEAHGPRAAGAPNEAVRR